MCIGDDGHEKLEFEMNLQVRDRSSRNSQSHFVILMWEDERFSLFAHHIDRCVFATRCLSLGIVLLLCVGLSLILCHLWKFVTRNVLPSKQPALRTSDNHQLHKSGSLTVHHDVLVTIRHAPSPQTRHDVSSETLTYIDEPTFFSIPAVVGSFAPFISGSLWSRGEQSHSALRSGQRPYRYSTGHLDTLGHYRNINGQPIQLNVPFIRSQSDTTLFPTGRTHEIPAEMRMLKISVPSLNAYPFIKSVVSFDSERELDEFNQMSLLSIDRQSPNTNNRDDECKQNTSRRASVGFIKEEEIWINWCMSTSEYEWQWTLNGHSRDD